MFLDYIQKLLSIDIKQLSSVFIIATDLLKWIKS